MALKVARHQHSNYRVGGGPRVVVSTAAFRGSVPGLGGLKGTKNVSSPSTCESQYCGSLRNREVACSTSDRQGSNFESCVWRTVSSQSSHHPQDVLLAQFLCAQRWHFISFPIAGFDEFNLLLAQPDPSDFKVMSHIVPFPNDIRHVLKN